MEETSTTSENARGSVEHVIREVFEDILKSDPTSRRFHGGDVSEECRAQLESYENAVEEIESAETAIRDVEVELAADGVEKRPKNDGADESTRVRRQLSGIVQSELAEKYALLESSDFLRERTTDDFPAGKAARERWKRRLSAGSKEDASKPNVEIEPRENPRKGRRKVTASKSVSRFAEIHGKNVGKTRRSIMRTAESQTTILVAQPNSVKFPNFVPGKIYKKAVLIKNVSNDVAKFQLEARSSRSKFTIVLDSGSGGRENLAPGMSLKMIVIFSSGDGDDYEDYIVFKVQLGKPVIVIASARRDPPILKGATIVTSSNGEAAAASIEESILFDVDTCRLFEDSSDDSWGDAAEHAGFFSSETSESNFAYLGINDAITPADVRAASLAHVDCGKCFVGERIVVKTRLRNVGGDGRFFAMSEFDWNSMSIGDVTTGNTVVLSCFAVYPAYFALRRNDELDLLVHFFPDSRGAQVDKIYIVCDNLAVLPVEFIGDGEVYEPPAPKPLPLEFIEARSVVDLPVARRFTA